MEEPDYGHARLLRSPQKRPRSCCTYQGNKFLPLQSITSPAIASKGTSRANRISVLACCGEGMRRNGCLTQHRKGGLEACRWQACRIRTPRRMPVGTCLAECRGSDAAPIVVKSIAAPITAKADGDARGTKVRVRPCAKSVFD